MLCIGVVVSSAEGGDFQTSAYCFRDNLTCCLSVACYYCNFHDDFLLYK